MLEKLNILVPDNDLMMEFVFFNYEVHAKSCCDGACEAAKFITSIKKLFDQNVSIERKKIFLIMQCLIYKDIFKCLFKRFCLVVFFRPAKK